ncbi:TVP38/TMEM64 family protein [Pseudanabaena sp. PCC 6802]|uniref:TVP38/TMEM64 family protein n=1 Tax=Pseudanabaena sp. PCC 6802 TaxID=118173 RepID=UPI000362AA25|nr:TVP38/TMEM64 family protein [Pseudanabaena sp. PCC 6802]
MHVTQHLKHKSVWIPLALTLLGIVTGGLLFTNLVQLQHISELVHQTGMWGYLVFIAAYVAATLLVLPSTAFNIAGGAIFGGVWGLAITSIAAITSAAIAFTISRCLGKSCVGNSGSPTLNHINLHLKSGGIPYAFAMRFLPIAPYGVVSVAGGLSQISKRDYFIGTILGTPVGLAPFVWIGHSGMQAAEGYSVLPLVASSGALALMIMVATWYKQNQMLDRQQ